MQIVYVEGGVVRVAPVPVAEGCALAECYHPDYVAACVQADDSVQLGWVTVDGGTTFSAPVVEPPSPAQLATYAEARQAALMVGGFAYDVAPGGEAAEIVRADTDVSGRLNLAGLVTLAQLNPSLTSVWVQAGGGLTLTAAEITALGVAVGTFVVQTYQALAVVLAAIAAGTITTTAQVDAAAWPEPSGALNPPAAS